MTKQAPQMDRGMCPLCGKRHSVVAPSRAMQAALKPCKAARLSQAPKRGRGRPALGEVLKRSRVVKLYMRPEELAEVSSRAEARGLSVSEYLRRRALGQRLPTE